MKGLKMVRKLAQWFRSIWNRKYEPTKCFRELTSVELTASLGGDPVLLWIDDPDLKPERVQNW
jgi:hypothetical protein